MGLLKIMQRQKEYPWQVRALSSVEVSLTCDHVTWPTLVKKYTIWAFKDKKDADEFSLKYGVKPGRW